MLNILSFVMSLANFFGYGLAVIVGILVGAFGYRYLLVKNPGLLNTLVTLASNDIEDIKALVTKKAAVLPTAVPVTPVVIAPTVVPTPDPVTIAAPVVIQAAPVITAPVAVAPAPPAQVPVSVPVVAPAVVVPAAIAAVVPTTPVV